jgi:hypothetical protein
MNNACVLVSILSSLPRPDVFRFPADGLPDLVGDRFAAFFRQKFDAIKGRRDGVLFWFALLVMFAQQSHCSSLSNRQKTSCCPFRARASTPCWFGNCCACRTLICRHGDVDRVAFAFGCVFRCTLARPPGSSRRAGGLSPEIRRCVRGRSHEECAIQKGMVVDHF